MPHWIFIRHGQSQANAEGWFAGHIDSPLTELGRVQARELQRRLAGRTIARVFASDLQRAHETAQLALEGRELAITTTPQLRERSLGAWEGRPVAEIEQQGEIGRLMTWEERPPEGESLRDTARRAVAWCREVGCEPNTLVVAHGALMRALIGLLDGVPRASIGQWRPHNCEVIEREVTSERLEALWRELARGADARQV